MNGRTTSLSDRLREHARALGFDLVGVARVRPSEHGEFYRRWLAAGLHGEMEYLARGDAVAARLDPGRAWPGVVSAVVVGMNYYQEDDGGMADDVVVSNDSVAATPAGIAPATTTISTRGAGGETASAADPSRGIISRYARGRDYHKVIKKKLLRLLEWLEGEAGQRLPLARAYVDTGPVFEREFARRAGLGWQGQNTMLINPRRGSYFFLAVLLVELELEYDEPFAENRCGSCSRCVEACPTGALLGWDEGGAPVIDATRCISYLTIEQKGPIPRELRSAIGNRVLGCDICQEVCPWNGPKFARITREPGFMGRGPGEAPHGVDRSRGTRPRAGRVTLPGGGEAAGEGWPSHPGTMAPGLVDLMEMGLDEERWDAFSRGSPIRRAGRAGFSRNVAVALGNWLGSVAEPPREAVAVLVRALGDPEPLVRGHAAWALGRVGTAEARTAVEDRLAVESDPFVRAEIVTVLGS